MSRTPKTEYIDTTWEVWTYDVWGNAIDGYHVNDRFCVARAYPMRLRVERFNPDTPQEFKGAYPADTQIRAAMGESRVRIETGGDDLTITVDRTRDGYPLGELRCVSHASLSPIRRAEVE